MPFAPILTMIRLCDRITIFSLVFVMLDWVAKSAWKQAIGAIIQVVKTQNEGKDLVLSITGINRLTGVPTNFLITQKDIPTDFDLVSPKLIPIVMANVFVEMTLYSGSMEEREMIISIKRPM